MGNPLSANLFEGMVEIHFALEPHCIGLSGRSPNFLVEIPAGTFGAEALLVVLIRGEKLKRLMLRGKALSQKMSPRINRMPRDGFAEMER